MIAPLVIAPRLLRSALRASQALGRLYAVRGPGELVARSEVLGRASAEVMAAHGVRVSCAGELPRRPVVLVANHVSYLDPLALMAAAPSLPIAKAEVQGWPIVGRLATALGVRFVRRDDPHSGASAIRWMIRALAAGASVLAFPEGTTSDGKTVLQFRAGAFAAARHAGVAVVPVAVSYVAPELAWVGDASFLPHYLRTASRDAVDVRLTFCEPLRPTRYSTDLELAQRARHAIATALQGDAPWDSSERSTTSRAA